MEIRIIYLTLFVLMFVGLYYGGKGIQKKNFMLMFFGVMSFTLNEGLRFGRWIDYNNLYISFSYGKSHIKFIEERYELLYTFLIKFIYSLDGMFQWLILIQSFIHVFAAVFFFRLYKNVAAFALPLYMLFSYHQAENLMRWYLGFAFVLIGIYYLFTCETKRMQIVSYAIFSIIGLFFHSGLILVIPVFLGVYFVKRTVSPVVSILIYFGLVFLFQMSFMMNFADMLDILLSVNERYSVYVDNPDRFLMTGALGIEKDNAFRGIAVTATYLLCVIVGYKLLPFFDKKYLYAYNLFVLGFLLDPIASRIELLSRISLLFIQFIGIILAYIIKYSIIKNILSVKYLHIVAFLIMLNYARIELMKPIRLNTDQLLYVWDKNGREYLDNSTVYFNNMRKNSN